MTKVIPDPALPQAPTSLTPASGTVTTDQTPTLSGAVTVTVTHEFEIASDSGFTAIVQSADGLATPIFTPTTLSDGTYYWHMRSWVNGVASIWTPTRMIQILQIPAAPTLISPDDGATLDDFTPTHTWSSVAGAATYTFQRATDDSFTTILQTVTGLLTPEYTPGSDYAAGTYEWRVYAVNAAGTSPASTSRSVALSSETPQEALLAKFELSGAETALYRLDDAGSPTTLRHYILSKIAPDKYLRWAIFGGNAVGNDFHRVAAIDLCRLDKWIDGDVGAGVTYSGTWVHSAGANYLGGDYHRSSAAGAYAERVTAANVTRVGVFAGATGTIMAFALVTIDGDQTRATLLPTAQALVTAGTMEAAALVANGGTLNPTDRIWDATTNTANQHIQFADDLTAGVHTVRITNTGYKRTTSTALWNTFSALSEGGADAYDLTTVGANWNFISTLTLAGTLLFPTIEISYNARPTGAPAPEWVGHAGSLKLIALPSWTVDGTPTTLANRTLVQGDSIRMEQDLNVRHSFTGVTNLGTLDMSFDFDSVTGMTIAHTLVWASSGVAVGYPGMMMVDKGPFDRFRGFDTAVVQLNANNDLGYANTHEPISYAWDFDGNVAMLLYITDLTLTVEDWAKTTTAQLWWADISASGGAWKKLYIQRFQSNEAYVNGTTWSSEVNYRTQWFAGGANAELGG